MNSGRLYKFTINNPNKHNDYHFFMKNQSIHFSLNDQNLDHYSITYAEENFHQIAVNYLILNINNVHPNCIENIKVISNDEKNIELNNILNYYTQYGKMTNDIFNILNYIYTSITLS